MSIVSLKDLYFDELGDLYDAETQMIRALARLAEAARAPELRDALRRHCDESRLHLGRLELIFTHWHEQRRVKPCAGVAGIVQEADERLHDATTDDVRDAAIIGAAQRIGHYEIAAYGCARTYARRLNRLDEARLLQETLDEEGRADRRLTELAEARINDDARHEADFGAPVRALAYVAMDDVARKRGSTETLTVLASGGEKLGTLDGLVVDRAGHARYIVVDGGGLLHRRHLLPVDLLRHDAAAGALHARVDADVAERYPAFDPDAFSTMSEADRGRYEARVLTFFAPGGEQPADRASMGTVPEWLLTGTWITVPASCAEDLPEDAREFVNEFAPVPSEAVEPPAGCERVAAQAREGEARPRVDERPARAHAEKIR